MHEQEHTGIDAIQINQEWWDERGPLHATSEFYQIESIIDGAISLGKHEIEEMGDVNGLKIVHLQCHLGTEDIGWARLGADVTGLDFSTETIRFATEIAKRSQVHINYVTGRVEEATQLLGEGIFDRVYVNMGSLHWLPDINVWAKQVIDLLKPGGILYVNEHHPVSNVLADDEPKFVRDYFDRSPRLWDEPGSYADTSAHTTHNKHVIYDRPLSDIITAIIETGLIIRKFTERFGQEYQQFSYQVLGKDGRWHAPEVIAPHPQTYSLVALKPELES